VRREKLLELLKKSGGEEEFGIDWEDALRCYWSDCEEYTLEECFLLPADPELQAAGVVVCARVINDDKGVRNRITFYNSLSKKASVNCTHTAVCDLPLGEAAGMLESGKATEFAKSLEGISREVDLPPWEHFKALRSYVAGVTDMGISNLMQASYAGGDPGELPFGFNSMMQKQVMKAIGKVAPNALNAVKVKAFWELREGNPDWLKSRFDLLDVRFKFAEMACKLGDPDFLKEVMRAGGAVSVFNRCPSAAGEVLASNPVLAGQLARDNDWDVRWGVAKNKSTPPAALKQLAGDEDWKVRKAVARNASTPPAALEQLTRDCVWKVRRGVAGNTSTPPALLEQLATDEDRKVREGVAGNNGTPPAVLEQLAADKSWDVRWGVVHNKATPPAVLEQLARDSDRLVREGVARNESTPLEVLKQLARDNVSDVQKAARESYKFEFWQEVEQAEHEAEEANKEAEREYERDCKQIEKQMKEESKKILARGY